MLAVVNGDGMRALFEGLGAHVLDGGATLNPSTYELLAGIHEVPAEEVVVLPNSPERAHGRRARRRALREDRARRRRRARWPPGLAAAVALDPTADARRNAAAMEETLRHVRTGGVTEAARDDTQGRFRRGDSVGFIDEELVAWGEPGETLEVVLGELGREAELLTVIEGDGAPLGGDAVAALAPDQRRGRALARRPAGLVVAGVGRVAAAPRTTILGVARHRVRQPGSAARGGAAPPALPAPVAPGGRAGVPGEKPEKAGARLGLDTVGDLLEHLPRDRRAARTVGELAIGEVATVVVEVRSIRSRPVRRRGMRPLVEAGRRRRARAR